MRALPALWFKEDDVLDFHTAWKRANERVRAPRWSGELLRRLDARRFEELCAAYLETLGFVAHTAPFGIHLYVEGCARPLVLAQCRPWSRVEIGVEAVRELHGLMAAHGIDEGAFLTAGGFSAEAKAFVAGQNLMLIDGADLLDKLGHLAAEPSQALLEHASRGG